MKWSKEKRRDEKKEKGHPLSLLFFCVELRVNSEERVEDEGRSFLATKQNNGHKTGLLDPWDRADREQR